MKTLLTAIFLCIYLSAYDSAQMKAKVKPKYDENFEEVSAESALGPDFGGDEQYVAEKKYDLVEREKDCRRLAYHYGKEHSERRRTKSELSSHVVEDYVRPREKESKEEAVYQLEAAMPQLPQPSAPPLDLSLAHKRESQKVEESYASPRLINDTIEILRDISTRIDLLIKSRIVGDNHLKNACFEHSLLIMHLAMLRECDNLGACEDDQGNAVFEDEQERDKYYSFEGERLRRSRVKYFLRHALNVNEEYMQIWADWCRKNPEPSVMRQIFEIVTGLKTRRSSRHAGMSLITLANPDAKPPSSSSRELSSSSFSAKGYAFMSNFMWEVAREGIMQYKGPIAKAGISILCRAIF